MPALRRHLFYETSHSPSLVDLVGYEQAGRIIDFCFIANPYYPTKKMLDDMAARLPSLIKSYPSSNPMLAQKHLAAVLHVNPANLLIGNGATELITILNHAVVRRLALAIPTFSEYTDTLRRSQALLYPLQPDEDYRMNLTAFLRWARKHDARSILVVNPANPTGQTFIREEMEEFLHAARRFELVIVDESFVDFAGEEPPSLLPVADRYRNLVIIRSMSKHCGVPGLRLGYAYTGNRALYEKIHSAVPTWNLNTLAQYFLSQLAATDAAYHRARLRVIRDVRKLYSALSRLPGFFAYPTGANFVLLRSECGLTAAELQRILLRDYLMYVRDCSNKKGIDNRHIRIATEGAANDRKLVAALRQIGKRSRS